MWGSLSVCHTRLSTSHLCLCPLSFASWGLSMLQAENKVFHFFPKLPVWKLQRWGSLYMFVLTASVQIYPFSVLRFPLGLDSRTTCPSCLSVSPRSESYCTSLTVFNVLATKGWVPQGQTNVSSFFFFGTGWNSCRTMLNNNGDNYSIKGARRDKHFPCASLWITSLWLLELRSEVYSTKMYILQKWETALSLKTQLDLGGKSSKVSRLDSVK